MEEIVSDPAPRREMPTAPDLTPLKGIGEKIQTLPTTSVGRSGSALAIRASGKLELEWDLNPHSCSHGNSSFALEDPAKME